MRKLLPFLFSLGLAFCQPQQYSAWLFDAPPTIDGDLTEYQGKMFLFLPNISIPLNLWRGPEDVEAKIWLGWDEDNLYIAADVWDDFLAQKGEPWQESLQLYIASGLEITYSSGQNKLFVFKNGTPFEETFPFAVKSTNASYQIELAIPWGLLGIRIPGGAAPADKISPAGGTLQTEGVALEGLSLRFNVLLYDTDMNGYRGYLSLLPLKDWKEGMGMPRDSSQFGEIILSPQPAPASQIAFLFAPSPLYIGDEEVDIPLWLMCNRDCKGRLKFRLKKDKDEETLLEREEDVERPAGFSSFPVHWNAKGAPEGTYIAQATLTIGDINTTLESTLTINKQDAQKLAASLQEESDIMGKAMAGVQPAKNWQDAVLILQGNAWQAQASPFLLLLNQKIKDAAQPDPDLRALAKGFLWDSRTDVAMYRASSSLIRRDFQSPTLQPFPTLRLPASKEVSYLWNWERWREAGSYERLSLLYANLPIASIALWSHPEAQVISLQRDSLLADWQRMSISPEQIEGVNWQGWVAVSPQGGARAIAQQENDLWFVEALSKDACLSLLNSALLGQAVSKIDSLLPPLQPDILVEDIGKAISFNFPAACFFAAKGDEESLALAQMLSDKLGGKMVRLEEVNRYKDVVIVGSTALNQLLSGFKFPLPERTAYILSRYLWGKNLLILVGKEQEGTRLAVDLLRDLIDYLRDKKMLSGDIQAFTSLASGKLTPSQLCLSAMGALCDFLGVADRGTREGARDALWLSAEKGWEMTVIPGETFSLPEGEVVSLGVLESIPSLPEASQLIEAIHKAGGMAMLGARDVGVGAQADAWLVDGVKAVGSEKPFVAGTLGDFSSPSRTVVFSSREGIYEILTAIKRGDCLAFSPYQRWGNEKINRLLNILLDEKVYFMQFFSQRVMEKTAIPPQ